MVKWRKNLQIDALRGQHYYENYIHQYHMSEPAKQLLLLVLSKVTAHHFPNQNRTTEKSTSQQRQMRLFYSKSRFVIWF